MRIKCPLSLGRIFQFEGLRNVDFERPTIDQFTQFGKRLWIGLAIVARDLHAVSRLRSVLHAVRVSGPAAFSQRRSRLLGRVSAHRQESGIQTLGCKFNPAEGCVTRKASSSSLCHVANAIIGLREYLPRWLPVTESNLLKKADLPAIYVMARRLQHTLMEAVDMLTSIETTLVVAYRASSNAAERGSLIRRYAEMSRLSVGRAEDALDLWAYMLSKQGSLS
jgi:hypothetical protein